MRIKKVYVAMDGEEFEDAKECLAHEKEFYNCIEEALETFTFLDENMKPYDIQPMNYFDDVERAYNECNYLRKNKPCSEEVINFFWNYFGFDLPDDDSEEPGLYKYGDSEFPYGGWTLVTTP